MAVRMDWKRQSAPLDDNNNGNKNGGNNGYNGYNGSYGNEGDWWWTGPGMATRYAIVACLFAFVLLFFVGGYYHAQHRIRKGLPPLAYHRWMVHRNSTRTAFYPPQPQTQHPYYRNTSEHGYAMESYPPPPPAYNPAEGPPPVYQPPPGATKAMADQNFSETNRAGEGSQSAGPAMPRAAVR